MALGLKKLKTLGLIILLFWIHWLPDDVIIYRERLFGAFKTLSDYRFVYTVVNWSMVFLVLVLGILIAYKADFCQHIRASFTWRNLIVLALTLFFALIVSWLFKTVYLQYFSYLTLKNNLNLNWYYQLSPKGVFEFKLLILAPFFEEMIYRAGIFKLFDKHRKVALLVSTLAFAWLHTGFTLAFVIYLPFSLILGAVFYRTGRLSDTILLHSGYNFLVGFTFYWLSHWTGFGG
jgi:membrane protease YdiL (CAAX protease family)